MRGFHGAITLLLAASVSRAARFSMQELIYAKDDNSKVGFDQSRLGNASEGPLSKAALNVLQLLIAEVTEKYVADPMVAGDWFKAKDNYMFKGVGEKTAESGQKMLLLVNLRSKFLCNVVFQKESEGCLFNKQEKAEKVFIPSTIPQLGAMSVAVTFTPAQQACYATALGSVTLLSDLDFTVICKDRKIVGNKAHFNESFMEGWTEAHMQAWDEVQIAKKLTNLITHLLGHPAGTIFDTNIYTNTFAYGTDLGQTCSVQPLQGVAMGLYAVAKGFGAAAEYGAGDRCKKKSADSKSNPFHFAKSDYSMTSPTTGEQVPSGSHAWRKIISTPDILKTMFGDRVESLQDKLGSYLVYFKIQDNPRFTQELDELRDSTDDENSFRTQAYFISLEIALGRGTKGTKLDHFCPWTALSLIFANEAYWVEGAIVDVVFQKKNLGAVEGMESVLMNLGYAMEHAVHEFEKAEKFDLKAKALQPDPLGVKVPSEPWQPYADIAKCSYGDGLVKFGKYMGRVKATLWKMGIVMADPLHDDPEHGKGNPIDPDGSIQNIFDKAQMMMNAKSVGKDGESGGNPIALPQQYVSLNEEITDKCAFMNEFVNACRRILDVVLHSFQCTPRQTVTDKKTGIARLQDEEERCLPVEVPAT